MHTVLAVMRCEGSSTPRLALGAAKEVSLPSVTVLDQGALRRRSLLEVIIHENNQPSTMENVFLTRIHVSTKLLYNNE